MNNTVTKIEPVTRSFVGMRDALFDMWDAIRDKTLDVREADVATKIAAGICKTVEIEIKLRKMVPYEGKPEDKPAHVKPDPVVPLEPKGFLLGTQR